MKKLFFSLLVLFVFPRTVFRSAPRELIVESAMKMAIAAQGVA
jgi:hypothetical protein